MAVVVSKKVNKSAVVRNRIRRRFYEAVRRREAEIGRSYDMVLTVFGEQTATMPAAELEATVQDLLRQADII
jgi:ribonuclease P protein component